MPADFEAEPAEALAPASWPPAPAPSGNEHEWNQHVTVEGQPSVAFQSPPKIQQSAAETEPPRPRVAQADGIWQHKIVRRSITLLSIAGALFVVAGLFMLRTSDEPPESQATWPESNANVVDHGDSGSAQNHTTNDPHAAETPRVETVPEARVATVPEKRPYAPDLPRIPEDRAGGTKTAAEGTNRIPTQVRTLAETRPRNSNAGTGNPESKAGTPPREPIHGVARLRGTINKKDLKAENERNRSSIY